MVADLEAIRREIRFVAVAFIMFYLSFFFGGGGSYSIINRTSFIVKSVEGLLFSQENTFKPPNHMCLFLFKVEANRVLM